MNQIKNYLAHSKLYALLKKIIPQKIIRFLKPGKVKNVNFFSDEPINLTKIKTYHLESFPDCGPHAWLDTPNYKLEIERKVKSGELEKEDAKACESFAERGYFKAEGLITDTEIDKVFGDYLEAINTRKLINAAGDPRSLNPHFKVPSVDLLLKNKDILRFCETFIGHKILPFQTIASPVGSQQLEHSDAIHMTTHPLGYMVAAWIACEDIHADSGPVVYYPGSHRLPYYLSQKVGILPGEFSDKGYGIVADKYEPFVQNLIKSENLAPEYFTAKKGDVLFWHHNLIHGGSVRKNPELSRKSIVCHYFAEGSVCYHDLSGVLAYTYI